MMSCFFLRFGDAIRIGNPVPIKPPTTVPYGRIIIFPFISNPYDWQTHDRAGPWALGLGFTPFPLDKINDALAGIKFPVFGGFVDQVSISCKDSGEFDSDGNSIYKVIRLIGTSKQNAPVSAFPPGYP